MSYAQIEGLVENYALGYYECTGADTSTVDYIGVGTNDSAWSVTTAGGQAWGHVVSAVENYVIQTNLQSQVVVWAASDMEPGFNGPYGTATINWVKGETSTDNPMGDDRALQLLRPW